MDLTVVQNPFDLYGSRTIFKAKEQTLGEIIDTYWNEEEGVELVISIDGHIVSYEKDRKVKNGDHVTLIARIAGGDSGKDVLRVVASLAVLVVATYVAGPAGTAFFSNLGLGATGAALATSATGALIGIGGSLLINAILPPAQAELPAGTPELSASNTYGWDLARNNLSEGLTLPVIYGIHTVTPHIISRHTETFDDSQRLNLLFALADGEIDEVADIKINGNDYLTYDNVHIDTRLGSNHQTVIPRFQDVISEKIVNQEITFPNFVQSTTDGNAVEGLGVGLTFPQGIFGLDLNTGEYIEHIIRITIEYSPAGLNQWNILGGIDKYPIIANEQKVIRKHFKHYGLSPNRYDIKVKFENSPERVYINPNFETSTRTFGIGGAWTETTVTETDSNGRIVSTITTTSPKGEVETEVHILSEGSGDNVKYVADMRFDYIQEVITDDFTYPNTALLAVSALATEQLGGSTPRITCKISRDTVQVHNGSDYVAKPATNPAWACYDMLHNKLYGGGIQKEQVIFGDFSMWADWCDAQSLTCNVYFDQITNLSDAIAAISTLGRGSIVQRGTNFGAIFDGTSTSVYLFSVGNIIADSFKESFIEKENRTNIVEVTFFDKNIDHERRSIEVRQDTVDSSNEIEKRSSVLLIGCTNQDMAARHAKYLLNSNKYLVRTISFNCEIDAMPCVPGDIISIQHDIPRWGLGGRIASSFINSVQLDRYVDVEASKNYSIIVKNGNDDSLEMVSLVNPGNGSFDTFTINGSWTTIPEQGWIYSIGESNLHKKDFRLISVERSTDLICTLTAVEYRAEVYDDTVSMPDYPNESFLPEITALSLDDLFRVGQDGVIIPILAVSWRGFAVIWQVYYKERSATEWIKFTDTNRPYVEITNLDIGKCYDLVVTTDDNPLNGITASHCMIIEPPEKVENLSVELLDNNVLLRWSKPESELPISHYEILKGASFENASYMGKADKTFTTFFERISGTYTYWVYAVDSSGKSGEASSVTIEVDVPLDYKQLSDFNATFDGNKVNLVKSVGRLIGPISTTETWESFFDDNNESTFQDFIDNGYTIYYQPDSTKSASYEEVIDLGALLSRVTVDLTIDIAEVFQGNISNLSLYPTLSVSSDNVNYIDYPGLYQVSSENIQYVKYKIDITTDDIVKADLRPKIKISTKRISEAGKNEVTDAVNGKVIFFTKSFADIESITVSPKGTSSLVAVYDFVDIPNPANFTIYLFDSIGNRATGPFSYAVEGI